MSDLVLLHHNEPMTTSLAIASGVQLQHKNILELIYKHIDSLAEFGNVGSDILPAGEISRFENANSAFHSAADAVDAQLETRNSRSSRGRPTEVVYLNEQQSTLLVTFMRNSEIVIRFKVALVKAFYAMRDRLHAPAPTLTTNLSHGADIAVAADRTFRSFMRAARSAGMALPAALRIANVKTVERTGIDMLAELDVDPDVAPVRPAPVVEVLPDPFVDALVRWASEVAPESSYRMADILRAVSGIEPTSKAFQRQSPTAGRVLRRLGWGQLFTRAGGTCPHRFWVKK